METLDLAIKTLFAEFQEGVVKRYALEQGQGEKWTYISKELKGKKYWYLQRYIDGKNTQKYFAPSNPANDAAVIHARESRQETRKTLSRLVKDEQRRAVILRRGGLPCLDALTSSVLMALSREGLIYKDGILVGSHAFASYCGMLGALFEGKSLKTLDIDMALDPIKVSAKKATDIYKLLKSISPQFHEVPGLSHKYPPHSFVGPGGLRVDVVAPLRGKPRGNIKIKNLLNAAAEPVRFLDFLMKSPIDAVLIGPKGGIPVTVPHPVRYAVHKLIVSSRRPATEIAKREKDILQARQLIEVCAREFPLELKQAHAEAVKMGKKWKAALLAGIARAGIQLE